MRIGINNEVFHDSAEFRDLYRIILNSDNRHNLIIDYPAVLNSVNFENLNQIDRDIISLSYVSNNRTDDLVPKITISKISSDSQFSCKEAILYLAQPVTILLEHGLNDRYFLEALFKYFDDENEIVKHIENEWIRFEHAGGSGSVKSIINGKFRSINTWPKKDKKVYLRYFVIFDSDKITHTSVLSNEKQKNIEYLSRNEVEHHLLSKREMENYLPEVALSTLSDPYLNEYCNLSSIQKDYFDLEKGLINDRNTKKMNPQIIEFYDSVNDNSWKILKAGINTAEYNRDNFKSEFAKLFNHSSVTKNSLLKRCGGTLYINELQEIVNKVKALL